MLVTVIYSGKLISGKLIKKKVADHKIGHQNIMLCLGLLYYNIGNYTIQVSLDSYTHKSEVIISYE